MAGESLFLVLASQFLGVTVVVKFDENAATGSLYMQKTGDNKNGLFLNQGLPINGYGKRRVCLHIRRFKFVLLADCQRDQKMKSLASREPSVISRRVSVLPLPASMITSEPDCVA